jgi:hypothetical protein
MADDRLSWEGIQLVWIVLGLFGAALGIGSLPEMSKKQCWVALGSGLVFSAYGPMWIAWGVNHWVTAEPMPPFMLSSTAFICGVGGMFLVPTIISFWQDPRAFLVHAWGVIRGVKNLKGGDQ